MPEGVRLVPTVIGVVLLLVTVRDVVSTVMSVSSGAGPLTRRIGSGVWRASLAFSRRFRTPVLLRRTGPVILFLVIAAWTVLLILGWALVFGQPETIVSVDGGEPAAFLGNVYFASATVTGIGSTALTTDRGIWRLAEQLAAASGVGLLGLSIAYILSVVQAVVVQREIAAYVHAIGEDAGDILRRCWDGTGFGELDLHLIALTGRIAGLAQRYLAYPIVHDFHSPTRRTAIGPAVVALDRVLLLDTHVLADDVRLGSSVTEPLERAITAFVDTVASTSEAAGRREVDWPELATLRSAGIPLRDTGTPPAVPDGVRQRERRLLDYLVHDGWGPSGPHAGQV